MKKQILTILCVLSVFLCSCSSADNPLSWKVDRIEEDTIYFCNGIQVILPENYRNAYILGRYGVNSRDSSTIMINEKQNYEAGYIGEIYSLGFSKKREGEVIYLLSHEFLGVYRDGEEEYALICGPTREAICSEELGEPYDNLLETVHEIQVDTSGMEELDRCDIEELDWIEYL